MSLSASVNSVLVELKCSSGRVVDDIVAHRCRGFCSTLTGEGRNASLSQWEQVVNKPVTVEELGSVINDLRYVIELAPKYLPLQFMASVSDDILRAELLCRERFFYLGGLRGIADKPMLAQGVLDKLVEIRGMLQAAEKEFA